MSLSQDQSHLPIIASDERRLWLALVEQAARSDRLQAELNTLRTSLSWRVTAPLRALRSYWSKKAPARAGLQPAAAAPQSDMARQVVPAEWEALRTHADDDRVQWFADVTELSREDLGAGVERVTRRLLTELLLDPPDGVCVQPVRLTLDGAYVFANTFLARFLGLPARTFGADTPVRAKPGDHFIGLDFCRGHASLLRQALEALRLEGTSISLIVHDVLPLTRPDWFPSGVPESFERWLRVLADVADRALCDSQQTAHELGEVLASKGMRAPALRLDVISLGADFPPSPSVSVLPPRMDEVIRVLTVGTLEPRKGHAQALAAFESLWSAGQAFEWVIAGKPGWNVEPLVARIRSHPEFGNRLRWVVGPDDRELSALYRECDVLLAPSLGEGYGLPVVEAGWQGLPLILRDLPVFREVAGDRATYFSGMDAESLARTLSDWRQAGRMDRRVVGNWTTWTQSASRLKELLKPDAGREGKERR